MAKVPFGHAAWATRMVSSGMLPSAWGYIDMELLLPDSLCANFFLVLYHSSISCIGQQSLTRLCWRMKQGVEWELCSPKNRPVLGRFGFHVRPISARFNRKCHSPTESFTGRFLVIQPPAKAKELHPMTVWLTATFSPSWIYCAAACSWAKAQERSVPLAVVVRAARPQKCVAPLEQSNSATAVANAWWPYGVRYAVRVRPPTRCTTAWHRPRLPR